MLKRPLPIPEPHEAAFWRGGAAGTLLIAWCDPCGGWRHPSLALCPACFAPINEWRPVSGRARVETVTVNHQHWFDGLDPPFLVGVVALAEDPSVRLTTNIVNASEGSALIGLPVKVCFLQQEDIWLPLFEPDPDGDPGIAPMPVPPRPTMPRRHRIDKFEDKVAFTGVGASRIGRGLGKSEQELAVEACLAAIEDAGLSCNDIDGICSYPGSKGLPGLSSGGVRGLENILRIRPFWHCGAHEVPGQLGSVINAMLAVSSGLCRHVLCFSSFATDAGPAMRESRSRVAGELSWRVPFGAASPANWIALCASRYLATYGASRELLATIAVTSRAHGALNPAAVFSKPIKREDYFNARMISSPFGLLDCDAPCDGAIAFIVSALECAADCRHPPIRVEAVGTRITEPQSWDQGTLTHQPNMFGPAAHLWTRTDLSVADIDVALLYDGFTFNVISWIEALGFCGLGEASAFIDGGRTISRGGRLPVNPHGGHLAAGRTNGYGHLHEAIVQLRGEATARQIADCKVALVSNGGGIPASCIALRRT